MTRFVASLLAAVFFAASPAEAAYVTLDGNGNVTGVFANPQPQISGYAQIADGDPRLSTFALRQSVPTQYQAAIIAGLTITSSGTPSLNSIYAIDPGTQAKIEAVALYIAVNGKFPAGQTSLAWADLSGAVHGFPTTAQFQAFATAVGDYVANLDLTQATLLAGRAANWPASSATIP